MIFKIMPAGSRYESSNMPKSVKLKLKGGGFVDPETGLEDKASVYKVSIYWAQILLDITLFIGYPISEYDILGFLKRPIFLT